MNPFLSLHPTCLSPGPCHFFVELCCLYYTNNEEAETQPSAEDLYHPTAKPVGEKCVRSIVGPEDIGARPRIWIGITLVVCVD